jgi:UDP-N-acetylmuramyl pentapeptide phosphotransferase/UDP-N-acetylglucosamine-1-phosphate transferase
MIINPIIYFIFILIVLLVCKKFNFFLDIKNHKHKKFASNQKNYFVGGFFIALILIYNFMEQKDYFYGLFFISIFIIGLLADFKLFNNPKLRLLIQISLLIIFVYILDIKIPSTRIEIVDILLENDFINYSFTVFCLAILINGSNFVDGINTLLINYYIIVLGLILLFLKDANIDHYLITNLLSLLIIILLFNLFGQIILGDSGAYILSLFVGLILIKLSNENNFISPYFIILLIWYPCFELLFSMIRRVTSNLYSYEPDTIHLHQMILKMISKNKKFKSNNFNHFLTGLIINLYNLLILIIALKYNSETNIMLALIFLNIILYVFIYFVLRQKLKPIQS